jgi:hypothetical protein
VPDTAVGVEGRTVRCAKCRHSWFQEGPELVGQHAAQAASPQPAPPIPAPEPAMQHADPAPAEPPAPKPVVARAEAAATQPPEEDPAPKAPPAARHGFDADPGDPPIAQQAVRPRPAATYDDAENGYYSDEARSSFEFEPPFRPRRNPAKMWTLAAILFALVALGSAGAVWFYGLPDWVPATRATFAEAQPDLVLDFPAKRQDRRTLPNGTEYFGASGTVTNVGQSRRTVPTILIVLRDERNRIVYSWEVVPPKRQLAPGESVTINEAVTDVPKSAVAAEIGWKPA